MSTRRDRFALCAPKYYGVQYVINPWMEGNVGRARAEVASLQWDHFRKILQEHAEVELIEPAEGLPDMPFTANAGLVAGDAFIPSRFRFRERQPEEKYFTEWFAGHGWRVIELPEGGTFEGEGDALFQPGEALVWGGYGVRTSLQVYRDLAKILGVEFIPLRLVDERFYHLDTCFCPLPGGRVIYYPEAFDKDSVEVIRSRVPVEKRHEVSALDAVNFACNAVIAGNKFIANFATDALRAQLANWGYEAILCPLGEFLMAGGAAKCLALRLSNPPPTNAAGESALPIVSERLIEVQGHLLDTGLMNKLLDCITEGGCSFEIENFQAGLRRDQNSWARIRVVAPSADRLSTVLERLIQMGARVAEEEVDARLERVSQDGVAPKDFYSTTIYPTDVRVEGRWIRAENQRMDAMLVVGNRNGMNEADGLDQGRALTVRCALMRDLRPGDNVVCGIDGIRIHATRLPRASEVFGFMSAGVSSERRVELAVDGIVWEMRRIRDRGGRIVVVAGPVVIHTGGGPHLAWLIRNGYVQVLLGGNAIAVHDIEQSLFGTSLGVDLKRGISVHGGHKHHLQAINAIRGCGGIAKAVEEGILTSGVMFECVKRGIPFSLAGSIRDDGPLPETRMNLIAAQEEYARLIAGADMILMLSSMLHSIGVGNMTPAGVRLICVDISPAVVTKLADRGSVESTGIVTDVGLFLNLLAGTLEAEEKAGKGAGAHAGQ